MTLDIQTVLIGGRFLLAVLGTAFVVASHYMHRWSALAWTGIIAVVVSAIAAGAIWAMAEGLV